MKPILKFGFFESKNGKVTNKDVYDGNNKIIGKYTGEIKDGKLNGIGKLTLANGDYFEGFFINNEIIKGKSFIKDKDQLYEGEFKDYLKNGEGKLKYWTRIFVGTWKDDKKNGNFKIFYLKIFNNGTTPIESDIVFLDDKLNGDIVHIYGNGTKYTGEGKLNRDGEWIERDGYGVCVYRTGKGKKYDGTPLKNCEYFGDEGFTYEGYWKNNIRHGTGVLKDIDGKIVADGKWSENKLEEGFLETREVYFIWPEFGEKRYYSYSFNPLKVEGEKFIGKIKNGKKHGKGITIHENGDKYEGEYEDGRENGQGICLYTVGSVYNGNWKNGKYHGLGKFTDVNGNIYTGNWENGLQSGKGSLHDSKNEIIATGEWENNKLKNGTCTAFRFLPIEDVQFLKIKRFEGILEFTGEIKDFNIEGKGIAIFESGATYEGEWVKNQRSGKGKNSYSNGNVYDGEWLENTPHGIGEMNYQIDEEGYLAKKGSKYSGLWENGKMHGEGSLTTSEGNTYKGIYSDNNFIEGTLTDKKCTIIQKGFWINEKCITSQIEKYIQANNYSSAIAEYKNYLENPLLLHYTGKANLKSKIKKEIEKLENKEKEFKVKDLFNSFENNTSAIDDFDDFE